MKELEPRSGIRFDLDSDGLTLCRFGQRVLCGGPSVNGVGAVGTVGYLPEFVLTNHSQPFEGD